MFIFNIIIEINVHFINLKKKKLIKLHCFNLWKRIL